MKEFSRGHFMALEDYPIEDSMISLVKTRGCCMFHCQEQEGLDVCKNAQKENCYFLNPRSVRITGCFLYLATTQGNQPSKEILKIKAQQIY